MIWLVNIMIWFQNIMIDEEWRERNKIKWQLDFSIIENTGIEIEKK